MELATQIISDSAFGCAGSVAWRCPSPSPSAKRRKPFAIPSLNAASSIRTGNGLDPGIQMGPVITMESKQRIESLISAGIGEGREAHPRWAQRQNPEIRIRKFPHAHGSRWLALQQPACQHGKSSALS